MSRTGIDWIVDVRNCVPAHMGTFALSNSKRILNEFVNALDGFYYNSVYYQDADSIFIDMLIIGLFPIKRFLWEIFQVELKMIVVNVGFS